MIFSSKMILWPQLNLGLFVAVNTDAGAALPNLLAQAVAAQIGIKVHQVEYQPVLDAQRFEGVYVTTRRNYSNYSKLLGLVDGVQVVYDRIPDLLMVTSSFGTFRYRQIGDNLFQEEGGSRRLVFTNFDGDSGNEGVGHASLSRAIILLADKAA